MAAPSRQSSAPTAKRAAIEAALLEATETLLAEGASFADLGVERIATQAGITRTAFYFYFADKRELLMALTADVNELLLREEQAAGLATCSNPSATAFALTWMTEGVLSQQVLQQGRAADQELIDALVEIWVRSVYGSA
jgi:AcrR family transcriptional regulator